MQFQDNPFASLQQPQLGQMAGPGGFAGGGFAGMLPQMGGMGGGMFGKPKGGGGFNPMMLSPFGYAMHKDPRIAFAMLSPALGIANLLGAFK